MRATKALSFFVLLVLMAASGARADADGAKGYVKEAEALIEAKDSESLKKAAAKLELAEAELDGVAEAAKAPIVESIKAAKQKIAGIAGGYDKKKYLRELERAMDDAEGSIGNLVTWGTAEREFNDVSNSEAAKAAIGTELAAAAKKFATFKKLHTKKASAQFIQQITANVEQLEADWKENKPQLVEDLQGNGSLVDRTSRDIEGQRKRIAKDLSPDDETTKALLARVDKVAAEFSKIALAGKIKEVIATLKRQIDLYKNDWEGFEAETTGPTWKDFCSHQSEKMSRFLAPKTVEFVSRISDFLAHLDKDEEYTAVKGDAQVKAIVDDIAAKRTAAAAKLVGFITAVVDVAEKEPVKDENALSRLTDDVRLALGEKSPEGSAMMARLKKKTDEHVAATTGAAEAKDKMIAMLRAKAEAEWPKLYAGIKWVDKVDLSKPAAMKGKNIGFLSDNLMGWRFKPGDYYFATTIGGIAVAARFDPLLKKQIEATEKAIGRSLGDDDSDGKWDIIAVVTDKKVKLLAKREATSTGKVGGVDVQVKTEYNEPVDAVVIEIIAAKCGPFAGSKEHGVLKVDGTIGK